MPKWKEHCGDAGDAMPTEDATAMSDEIASIEAQQYEATKIHNVEVEAMKAKIFYFESDLVCENARGRCSNNLEGCQHFGSDVYEGIVQVLVIGLGLQRPLP